ncbi:hypothetical protein M7I_0136 [Glarea lozoyensis 74030]|uniref:Uncharacterized protein n=1 Tax=Glarea lozoyensis (strain ATCC 74030 / MF5533) TaxID=1104152 RepID=H0ECJ4_GLAL7|nr:hypothetical protein M7I_0136 [Glarea lozoyensis 74030]
MFHYWELPIPSHSYQMPSKWHTPSDEGTFYKMYFEKIKEYKLEK